MECTATPHPQGLGTMDSLFQGLHAGPSGAWGLVREDAWHLGWVGSGDRCCRNDCQSPLGKGDKDQLVLGAGWL